MKRYLVQIRGNNFILDLDGDHGKFGFSATRVIRANSDVEAERIALIQIRQELNQSAHRIKNSPDAPRVYAKSVSEMKFFQLSGKKVYKKFEFISED